MVEHRLSSILAMDIVGYSALMQKGSASLLKALDELFRSTIKPKVKAYGGRVVKLMGDGAIVEFTSARNAVLCASEIQDLMGSDPPPYNHPERLALRMGIHAGDVTVSGADIFGESVNIAARLEAAAPEGGVLISKLVADLAGSGLPLILHNEGIRRFKNIEEPLQVFSVVPKPDGQASTTEAIGSDDVRFTKSEDGVNLAWTLTGKGPPLVRAPAWISRLDLDMRLPHLAHFIKNFSKAYSFIRFDARGNGLSDREIPEMSFDQLVEDLRAVFDAAGVDRAPILGMSQGCAVASAFAARYPERVSGIVMVGGFALGRAKRPEQKDRDRASAVQAMMKVGWDDDYPSLRDMMADMIVPLASVEDRRQFAEAMLKMVTPEIISRYRSVLDEIDVTDVLPHVETPCLVLHCDQDRMHPAEQGRLMASLLPSARFVSYESPSHIPSENDPCWPQIKSEIDRFLAECTGTGH
ncbi:alpha/beta fold hydrolase [Ovoidimarina sediminis]|uniref:alpha/beta fold hydrolase n=1 Tax=Ovoidimarina sediminis TaxID=3079856 RepID=UPI00291054BD|nr:alpha/beta fold hydrolase [Rhodophyticola sp. MJ-SS7]MDU8946354.1 alpha/beta fold hydrolase [Rhodophyticola sp. MJ-SS7]